MINPENADTSIKFNLQSAFLEFKPRMDGLNDNFLKLIREVNSARFNQSPEFNDLQLQKIQTKESQESVRIQFYDHFNKYIQLFLSLEKKKIIQIYEEKMTPSMKEDVKNIANLFALNTKQDPKIFSIAKPGTSIDDLINQTKKESQNNKPNTGDGTGAAKQSQQTQKNDQQNKKPQANDASNQTATQAAPAVKQPSEKVENNNSQPPQQKQEQKPQQNQQKKKANKDEKKLEGEGGQRNQQSNHAMNQGCCEEHPTIPKKRGESIPQDDATSDNIETRNEPPDGVLKYKIVSMTNKYELSIEVEEPSQNSHPICEYEVHIVQPRSQQEIDEIDWDKFATSSVQELRFDLEFLTRSNSNIIVMDLAQVSTSKFMNAFNDQLNFIYFTIIARSTYQQKSGVENKQVFLSSPIRALFQLSIPKIIRANTEFLMTGSTELISRSFFQNPSVFEGSLGNDEQSIKNFLPLNNEDIFALIQPQSVNIRESVMLLLKNGSVLQWGEIPYFEGNRTEYPLPECVEEIDFRYIDIFMPVQEPEVFLKVSQGIHHYAGISLDGRVYTWGLNNFGQLGHQNYICYPEPKKIDLLQNVFIVDIQCGDNFTVCLSIKGELYTFGKNQALEGKEINDSFNQTINYCNEQFNQVAPRKIACNEKVIQFSVAEGHCVFLTEKNNVFIWGDNNYMQVCQQECYQYFSNFSHPIMIIPMNGVGYNLIKVIAQTQYNIAVFRNIETGNDLYVQWGGGHNKWLDLKRYGCEILQVDPTEVDGVYFNRESSIISKNGNLFAKGNNFQNRLGVASPATELKVETQIPLEKSDVISASIGIYNSGVVITKTLEKKKAVEGFID